MRAKDGWWGDRWGCVSLGDVCCCGGGGRGVHLGPVIFRFKKRNFPFPKK